MPPDQLQGPLARTIRDLRLGLVIMAPRDPRDPWWVPVDASLEPPLGPVRVGLFSHIPGSSLDPSISAALRRAAGWLEAAGYMVEEVTPPHFEEAARLFFTLVRSEERTGTSKAIEQFGDASLHRARASTMAYASELDYDGYIGAFGRRASILREWLLFFERHPLLLMPVSCELPLPVDFDQQGDAAVAHMMTAHHPLLAVSVLGLPGLAVPTGLADDVPVGVQLVASRFREDVCLAAGEIIEASHAPMTPIEPRV